MQDQLKELKGQLTKGRDTNSPEGENQKPTEPVSLLTQKQVKKTVKQLDSEHVDDDKVLFMQAMHGVNQLEDKNVRSPASTTKAGKPDAATLSKRAAAQGSDASDLGAGLSDMQVSWPKAVIPTLLKVTIQTDEQLSRYLLNSKYTKE